MCYHINVYNYCCPHATLVYCHHCYYWKQWPNEEEEPAYHLSCWCTYALVESLKPNMGGGATMFVMITYTHTYCSHHFEWFDEVFGLHNHLVMVMSMRERGKEKHKKRRNRAPFGNGWAFFLHIFLFFVLFSPNTLRSRPFFGFIPREW